MSSTANQPPERMKKKVAIATFVGTTIEWYDFYLYGVAAALIFAPQFFPSIDPVAGMLASFATFGVGFLARPVGALIFGHFGDRIGRKGVLIVSLILTGVGTFLVGVLPNFEMIGVAAPILLVALRLVQGIGVGGEVGGALLMAGEHAPKGKRGSYAGWPQLGSGVGLFLANGVFLITRLSMSEEQFTTWGWRVPFLLSIALVIFGLWIRTRLEESPKFTAIKERNEVVRNPIKESFKRAPLAIALVAGVFMMNNTAFYFVNTFGLSYATNTVGIDSAISLTATLVGAVILSIFTIVFSRLSDKVGRKRIIVTLFSIWLVYGSVFFLLLNTANIWLVLLAFGFGTFLTSAYGPIGAFMQEQFPTAVRYTAMSVAMQIGSVIGGGVGPFVGAWLGATFGPFAVAAYIGGIAVISLLCIAALPKKSIADREEEEEAAMEAVKTLPVQN